MLTEDNSMTAGIILNSDTLRSGKREGCPFLPLLFNIGFKS